MRRKYKNLGLILFLLLILTSGTFAIKEDNNSNGDTKVQYSNKAYREIIIDAPWVIEPGKQIPLSIEVHEADEGRTLELVKIEIHDQISGEIFNLLPEDLDLDVVGSCSGKSYTEINDHLWNYLYYLDPDSFGGNTKKLRVNVWRCPSWLDGGLEYWKELEIEIRDKPFPKLNSWVCGDTHYHSSYTDTWIFGAYGELGSPIEITDRVVDVVGLDWFVVTDHSNSFNGNKLKVSHTWNEFTSDCNSSNNCLIGEEINCDYYRFGKTGNHYLGYNLTDHINDYFNGFSPSENNPFCEEIIQGVKNQNGFGYIAHPEYEYTFGLIIDNWYDYSLDFTGLQVWNGDLEDDKNKESLEEGLINWTNLILDGRKVYIEAGSDAHGDFNKAFGKTMTCVYSPVDSSSSKYKSYIYTALKNGHAFLTNNGALNFEINDVMLGEETGIQENLPISLDIDYDLIENCDLKIFKGIIGGSEQPVSITSLNKDNEFSYIDNNPPPISSPELYYRLECIGNDDTKRIYTNPIWVNIWESISSTLVSPFNNTYIPNSTVIFNISANDNVGLNNISLFISTTDNWQKEETVKKTGTNESALFTIDNIQDGTYLWKGQGCDVNGNCNESIDSRMFIVDTIIPNLTLNYLINHYNTSNSKIVFNATAKDRNLGNVSLYGDWSSIFVLNQTDNSKIDGEYIFNPNISDGIHLWNIKVCDLAGNCNVSENRTFTLDSTAPNISNKLPINNTEYNHTNINFSYFVLDNLVGTNNCSLWLSDNNSSNLKNNLTYEILNESINQIFNNITLEEGEYVWFVECSDKFENDDNSSMFVFNVSIPEILYPPEIISYEPDKSVSINEGNLDFKVVINDTDDDVLFYEWYLDSVNVSTEQNFSYSFTEGNYNVTFFVRDDDNGSDSMEWDITVTKASTGGGGGGGGGGGRSSTETTPDVPVIPYVPFIAPIEVTPTEPEEVPKESEDTTPTGFFARNVNGRNVGIGIGLIVLIVVGIVVFKLKGGNKKKIEFDY